jgi:hypothetical protein
MKHNITRKRLALIVILILFSGFIWTNRALAWTTRIYAEGEALTGVNQANVKIGVALEAKIYPAAPSVPKYSVKMDLYSPDLTQAFGEDIRQEGDTQHTWIIGVDPHGNVGPDDPRAATLSWHPAEFGPGTYQLQEGYDGTGTIVVTDMTTTTSYVVQGPEGTQYFTLIFTEVDSDGDGVPDRLESCPNDPNKTEPGVCGCGVADIDSDTDGILDCHDNCPNISNPGQEDGDGDGAGNPCDNCPNQDRAWHMRLRDRRH